MGNNGSNAEEKDTENLVVLPSDPERLHEPARAQAPHQAGKVLVLPARGQSASEEKTPAQTKERLPDAPQLDEVSAPNFSSPEGRIAYFTRGCYAGRGMNVRKLRAPGCRLRSKRERRP